MRTSNKILAGTFLLILLIITSIHLALYAKYKSNNFITMKNLHEERYESYDLKGIQSVSLTGIQYVTIIPSDTARVEIEKSESDRRLHHEFANGILTIKGDTMIMRNNDRPERVSNYRDVILYLPRTQIIKSDFCNLNIRGSKDSSKASSLELDLNDTELRLGYADRQDAFIGGEFNKISITKASGGSIDVSGDVSIKELSLNMESSKFDDGGAKFDVISINSDSKSAITIKGKNIPKTKLTLK